MNVCTSGSLREFNSTRRGVFQLTLELADVPHDRVHALEVHVGLVGRDGVLGLEEREVGRDDEESDGREPQVAAE